MNENNFELGSYLKTIRNEYGITTRSLGNKIGYSHSYISSVENNAKRNPSQDFIEKYLLGITSNNINDTNFFIENINNLSNEHYKFNLLNSYDGVSSNLSEEVKKFVDTRIFTYKTNSKKINKEITKDIAFEIPINDIDFHLTDNYNFKFFGGVPLYETERKQILNLICNYLTATYTNQLRLLNDLYRYDKMSKANFEEEKEKFEKYLELLRRIEY